MEQVRRYCAFIEEQQIAQGDLLSVALAARDQRAVDEGVPILIFDLLDGRTIDVLLQGTDQTIADWIDAHVPESSSGKVRQRGRPKLGVVGREVTLLPRQWEWLTSQPGGASVTLRRLVDEAAKSPEAARNAAREATYRFLNALAGNYPGFEECLRALYAGDRDGFAQRTADWPVDVRQRAEDLALAAW